LTAISLLQKLLHDLRSTLVPQYEQLLAVLLPLSTKSLAPEVLPVYLQALSTLFKYLLLPQPDSLPSTWTSVQSVLRSCTLEMQRMLGEVVGTMVRKLKSEDRLQMVQLLVDEQDDLENSIAWTFASATQSVSNTLHTTAPSLVSALLDRHLVSEYHERTFRLLRRVLSSAVHHSTIESFASVAEALVLKLEEIKAAENEEQLARVLEVMCVVCAFRKGKKSESMLEGE
jgi:U3 small nucleolar RNA-associated protein 20